MRRRKNSKINREYHFNEYIYGQGYGDASRLKLGFFEGSHNGCGWIGVYNALRMLGEKIAPWEIIDFFEACNPLRIGLLGVHPLTLIAFLVSRGYKVRLSFNPEKFDKKAASGKASILFYCKNFKGHFFAIENIGSSYNGYNVNNNQRLIRSFPSLGSYIRNKGWLYVLIQIDK